MGAGTALEHLANELDVHLSREYDDPPEVEVQASNLHRPAVAQAGEHAFMIVSRPDEGDQSQDHIGIPHIKGALYGFHHAVIEGESQLCAYISQHQPALKMRAGIYLPLFSVPLESSDIRFASERKADIKQRLGGYILEHDAEHAERMNGVIKKMLTMLDDTKLPIKDRLLMSGRSFEVLLHLNNGSIADPFADTLFDAIRDALRLSERVSLATHAYRIITSTPAVRSFVQQGDAEFKGVQPQLELIGESKRRMLGLSFFYNDQSIQVPVHQVHALEHTDVL
jgi:hypothetical protein